MSDVKNKMYNYEVTPPEGVWNNIARELVDKEAKVIPLAGKKKNTFYYAAAAAVAVILFCLILFTNRSSKSNELLFTDNNKTQKDTAANEEKILMTVPREEKTTAKNTAEKTESIKHTQSQKGGPNENTNESIRETDSNLLANNSTRYITIEGPQGQPVKISSKMASLIDSSETKVSTKPVWHKKIDEWKEIMKANTLAPTPGNFLDIVELTKSLRDNKK